MWGGARSGQENKKNAFLRARPSRGGRPPIPDRGPSVLYSLSPKCATEELDCFTDKVHSSGMNKPARKFVVKLRNAETVTVEADDFYPEGSQVTFANEVGKDGLQFVAYFTEVLSVIEEA